MTALDRPPSTDRTRYRPGTVLAFVSAAQFMVFLAVSGVNLALPSIQADLGMSDVSLGYIVTAYATVLGGFLLLGGRLADRMGRRRVLQAGFWVFALASIGAGFAPDGVALIAARAAQGLGAALIAPAALAILTNTFPEGPERNKALGVWGSLAGIASIVGVIVGGALTDGPGWAWLFWLNAPVGVAAALLAPRLVPDSRAEGERVRFDTAGAATLTAGLLLLIFVLGEATRWGWGDVRTIGGLAAAAALLTAFVLIEARTSAPIMPLRVFRLGTMRTANLTAVLVFGCFTAMFFFVAVFMQKVYGYSPMEAGFAYVPLAVMVGAGAGIASGLTAKFSARTILAAGLAATIAGLLLMWRAPVGGGYLVDLLPAFLLLGLGCGMCYVTLQIAAFVGVSDADAGLGAGLINTSQEAGGALGLAVIATIAYNGMAGELAEANGADAVLAVQARAGHDAFLTAAGFGLAALAIALVLMPKPGRTA
jgi:EmrB/QacA subfamily drug resistance transporter